MSYRSEAYHPHAGQPARHHQPQRQAHPVSRHAATARDYILGHAGRQLRLGPIAFWIVVGTAVIMAVWTVATATYFAFREDVLTRLIGRQAEMQFAYEDRIAELRGQIDRITGRQLLDQETFEQKLDQLLRRQTALEQRASSMNSDYRFDQDASARKCRRCSACDAEALADRRQNQLRASAGSPRAKCAG